ncbi:MAG TPA: hypothetical protein VGE45_13725, partial [Chloroflexia bacterium]
MMKQETNTRRGIPMAMVMVVVAGLVALALALTMAARNTPSGAGSAPAQAGSKANAAAAKVTVRLYDRQFTSTTTDQAGPRARTRFSSSADNQLYVQMTWSGVEQTHDAYVTFYSPDGKIYQVLDVPFTTTQPDSKSGSGELYQNRPGVLHPVKVSR